MVEINLVAWREKKSRYERKKTNVALALSVLAVMLSLLVARITILSSVHDIERKMKIMQAKLSAKKEWYGAGQHDVSGHAALIHYLKKIAATVHAGICYERVVRDDAGLHVVGVAYSPQAVMLAWRQLAHSVELSSLKVSEMKQDAAGGRLQFTLLLPSAVKNEE